MGSSIQVGERAPDYRPPPKEQPPRKLSGKVDRLDIKRWKAGDLFAGAVYAA